MKKHKMILDCDADGSRIYKEMVVQEQRHPKLLPYACYDWSRNEFLIGLAITKAGARKLIDKYIADGKNWIGYEISRV